MAKREVIRNDKGEPFSKWKPSPKFEYMLKTLQPDFAENCTKEFAFDHDRQWRFDFAWPTVKVAVEIDGFGLGHQASHRLAENHQKQNAAVHQGWKVLRFTTRCLGSKQKVEDAVDLVARVILGI